MPLVSTSGVADVIRGGGRSASKAYYFNVEIVVTAGVRVFTGTDLDDKKTAAVVASTGVTITISKGADGNRVFGMIEGIDPAGVFASVLGSGETEYVKYSATAPVVGDRIVSKGDATVKQATDLASTGAGGQLVGDGFVTRLDTANTQVTLRWPS